MHSKTKINEKGNVQNRSDKIENRTSELRFQSTESFSKKKVVKAKLDYNMFMSTCEMFEKTLNELKIEGDSEKILEKLIKIEKVIKEKIYFINENKNSECKNKEIFKALSMESLCSKASDIENNAEFDLSFAEFSVRVNCPFCSESKPDKVKLIEHLDEGCKPRINKVFDQKYPLPLSVFQILPNNTFKCNVCPHVLLSDLKYYFAHLQKDFHISAYNKVAKHKNYTEFLFCSCCKMQVANNFTQIHFHINHQFHKSNADHLKSLLYLKKKGIYYIYHKNKKFKCLNCPQRFYSTPGDILNHFEDQKHIENVKRNTRHILEQKFFCEICSTEVLMTEIFKHFILNDHTENNKIMDEINELCFFCGFVCDNLLDLSQHMESKCSVIDTIRSKIQNQKKTAKNNSLDRIINESNAVDRCIIVKGYKDIPTLFSYFEQFDEIASLKTLDDEHILLQFKGKNTAECILLVKDRLNINGVEIEITTDVNLSKPQEKMVVSEEVNEFLSEDEKCSSSSDSSDCEEGKDSNEERDLKCNEMLQRPDQLRTLFERVAYHLENISQRPSSTAKIKTTILRCLEDCIGEACSLVGFASCDLSFPLKSISLYCEMRNDLPNTIGSISVNTLIFLRKLCKEICKSKLWQNVIISPKPFPHIKCIHNDTQKPCTITCARPTMLLTEMLRNCLTENNLVRPFCVLVRFWLNVHKLKIRKFEYVIMSFCIFFLISKKVVNISRESYYTELDFTFERIIQGKLALYENLSSEGKEVFNLQKLFREFLQFLCTFDFDNCAIYLPLPYPLPKVFILTKLTDITESSSYDKVRKSPMCVTESHSLQNLASCVSEEHLKSLLETASSTIKSVEHS